MPVSAGEGGGLAYRRMDRIIKLPSKQECKKKRKNEKIQQTFD